MGVGDGQDGYGFARRDMPPRKKVGRRTAVPAGPPPTGSLHRSASADAYAPHSRKPAWIWLLIGVLLGTGGTLMTASFWFPEGGNREIAALETSADSQKAPQIETVTPENEAVAPEDALEVLAADDGSAEAPGSSMEVAAVTAVPAVPSTDQASPGSETTRSIAPEPTLSDLSPPETPSSETSPRDANPNGRGPETVTTSEQLLPAASADATTDIERRPDEAGSSEILLDPEAALAALVSKDGPAPTSLPQPREDTAARTRSVVPAPALPTQPSPEPLETAATATIDELVRRADDQVPSTPVPSRNTSVGPEDPRPARVTERTDLPPRIKQALLQAAAESRTTRAISGERLYRVQLAAVDNEAAARIFWREVNARLPGVFTDVEPIFDKRVVDERQYLRIWVGAFDTVRDADGYCAWLKQQGQDCFVTRVDKL